MSGTQGACSGGLDQEYHSKSSLAYALSFLGSLNIRTPTPKQRDDQVNDLEVLGANSSPTPAFSTCQAENIAMDRYTSDAQITKASLTLLSNPNTM